MPLYEYKCAGCRHSFEVLQSLGAGPDGLACPKCGGTELAKQFSTFAPSSAAGGGTKAGAASAAASGCGSGFT